MLKTITKANMFLDLVKKGME